MKWRLWEPLGVDVCARVTQASAQGMLDGPMHAHGGRAVLAHVGVAAAVFAEDRAARVAISLVELATGPLRTNPQAQAASERLAPVLVAPRQLARAGHSAPQLARPGAALAA